MTTRAPRVGVVVCALAVVAALAPATPASADRGPRPSPDELRASVTGGAFAVWEVPASGVAPGAPVVALTFDDGPSANITPAILDVLRAKGVPATFFVVGDMVARYPDLARRAVAEGHSVQSHTMSHADLRTIPASAWSREVDGAVALTRSITGRPVTCLRPPYGSWNQGVSDGLRARGLTPVLWNVDPGDTRGRSSSQIAYAAVSQARPGSIIGLHDAATKGATLAALPAIIDGIRAKGLGFTSLCGPPPPPPIQVRDVATFGGGAGYVLKGDGSLHAFGGAPPREGPRFGVDLARRVVLRSNGTSGYVLDAWGGLHPFGGAPAVAAGGYWPFRDVARGLALRPDGRSGWVLDLYGGLHPFGGAPPGTGAPYWPSWDIARDVMATPSGQGGYVLDGFGSLHRFGDAPVASGVWSTPGWDGWRGLVPAADGLSGWRIDATGGLHAFGRAPRQVRAAPWPGRDMARGGGVFADGITGVVVDRDGRLSLFRAMARTVGVAVGEDGRRGYALDAFGGLRAFGGAPPARGPSWPGWDIARAVALRADGTSGYVLDGWGGLHPFGGAPAVHGPSWPGWDIARALALRADGRGWVLDALGGLHPINGAPPLTGFPYRVDATVAVGVAVGAPPAGERGLGVDVYGRGYGLTG